MSDELHISAGGKEEKYMALLPQIKAIIDGEEDFVANLANTAACLKQTFDWLWVGFYIVKKEALVLGPFQGPIACTRIKKGKGVCGTAWERAETIIVDDVEKFPGHIACSSLSKSEIVVPIIRDGNVIAVLDADSENIAEFEETDKNFLEKIVALL